MNIEENENDEQITPTEWNESPEEEDPGQISYEAYDLKKVEKKPSANTTATAVLTFQERKHLYANRLVHSFLPFKFLLIALGRYPLTSSEQEDGTRIYNWSWMHPNGLYFILVTIALFYILIVGSVGMFAILVDLNFVNQGLNDTTTFIYEKALVERHMIILIVLWTSLAQCCIASISLILKRDYVAVYMSYWIKAVQKMHTDVAKGALRKALTVTLLYVGVIAVLTILSAFQWSPTTSSAPTLIGILMFREFFKPLYSVNITTLPVDALNDTNVPAVHREIIDEQPEVRFAFKIAGGVFLLIIYASSKVYLFVYVYYCNLLRNGFAHWNARLHATVLKGGAAFKSPEGRRTLNHLFRDHCVLLDLIEGTDRLFTGILESYYGLQVLSLCYELYFVVRTIRYGSNREDSTIAGGQYFIRPHDWTPAVLVCGLSITVMALVSLAAAEVGEEAMGGLDVIRRKSLVGRKTDEELFFTLTMFNSFTSSKRLELSGGGYFYITKEFLVMVVSTMLSYFIVLYQFQPSLDHKNKGDWTQREILGKFLTKAEGIQPPDHYFTSTATSVPVIIG